MFLVFTTFHANYEWLLVSKTITTRFLVQHPLCHWFYLVIASSPSPTGWSVHIFLSGLEVTSIHWPHYEVQSNWRIKRLQCYGSLWNSHLMCCALKKQSLRIWRISREVLPVLCVHGHKSQSPFSCGSRSQFGFRRRTPSLLLRSGLKLSFRLST